MTMENQTECAICHIPQGEHNRPNILHQFCPPGRQSSLVHRSQQSPSSHEGNDQGSNGVQRTSTGSDMILRLALVRKGIITPEDLDQIEVELRTLGVATNVSPAGSTSHP